MTQPQSTHKTKSIDKKKGFTLLFASLTVSLILAIGLAIANISLQQFLLSSSGKDSQIAFYNADAGIECALYYDHGKVSGFAFPTDPSEQNGQLITCGGQIGKIVPGNNFNYPTTTTIYVINPVVIGCDATKPSFQIEVNKAPGGAFETFKTDIRARGYNTCEGSNPRRVERGLEVKY